MTAPVKNNEVPANDPYADGYGTDDPYGYDDGFGDADMSVDDGYGMDEGGGDPQSACLTISGAREYVGYLEDLLKDSSRTKEEKEVIEGQIKSLNSQINKAAGFTDPALQQQALTGINDKLCDIENDINGVNEEGEAAGDDGSVAGQTKNIMDKADAALAAGTINQTLYDKIKAECDKATDIVGILGEEDGGAEASEHISAAMDLLVGGASSDPKTQAMADALGVSIEDLQSAADAHNVDLSNPQPTDDLFQMFAELAGLSPDEIKGAIDKRYEDMKSLKSDLESETETWRAESENPPSRDKFNKSFDYYNKTDSQFTKITGMMEEIANNPKTKAFFEAAGFSYATGPTADQITLNGTAYDFYNNDKGTFGLSSNKSSVEQEKDLFAPAPKNTEARTNEGTPYTWFFENKPGAEGEGYPDTEFSGA